MSTDHDFKTHPSSQKMKCLVGDYLNSYKDIMQTKAERYCSIIQLFLSFYRIPAMQTFTLSTNNSQQLHNIRIKELSSFSCFTYLQRDNYFIFIYATKKQVTVIKFQQTKDGFQPGSQVCRAQYAFEANDGFKVISKPLKVNDGEYILAYSEKDEFYLLSLYVRGTRTILEVTKLIDQDKSNNIWNWITRQKNPHYEEVKIIPLYSVDVNGYQFLCLRDNTAAVFYISLKEQVERSTIKQMYACSSLPANINIKSLLLSAHLVSQKLALIAYFHHKITLVKLSIVDDEHTLTIQKINLNIHKDNFRILQCKDYIYFNFSDSRTSNYKCIKFEANLKQLGMQFENNEPLFESHNPIWLCGNNKELFLINSYNIYQIEQDSDDSGLPQQLKKYQSFEAWLERTFNKKIKKQSQLRDYYGIQALLQEKQSKLIAQYKHLKKSGLQENFQVKISQKIICTFIVKSIISKKDQFAAFLSNIQHPNIQVELIKMQQENLLENLFVDQSAVEIQSILIIMSKMQMFEYINDILEEVKVHPQRKTCSDIINTIFSDVCSNAIHTFKTNNKNRNISVHKILMEYTFNFIEVDQESFIEDFLFLANKWKSDESRFVHNLVLNAKLIKVFMHLFINSSKIIFTVDQITEIVSNLTEAPRQVYLSQFFDRLKEEYTINEKDPLKKNQFAKKCAILVRGLTKYAQQIKGILSNTFPGLLGYLLLKNPQQNKEQLIKIAEKCSNPATAYMLCLSSPSDDRKQWKKTLAKIRLCKELLMPYNNQGDILKDIEEGKHKQKPMINEEKWKKSVQILEIPKERVVKLAQNLIIVR